METFLFRRLRSSYPSAGCSSAEPASVSLDRPILPVAFEFSQAVFQGAYFSYSRSQPESGSPARCAVGVVRLLRKNGHWLREFLLVFSVGLPREHTPPRPSFFEA